MSQRCSNFMINFLIRMAVGVMLILVINGFFVSKEIPVRVGLNPITMAASGTLGVPGVALLYDVAFYERRLEALQINPLGARMEVILQDEYSSWSSFLSGVT